MAATNELAKASDELFPAPKTPPPLQQRAEMRWRFLRAYLTTVVVIASYLFTNAGRRLFGDAWFDSRIVEVHRRNARRVERTIIALSGLFIKVGQLLSIMANFLPEEFRAGLSQLQDQVPARPFEEIEQRIVKELGKPISALFKSFERKPIASASLGQVHEAWLADGTHVVVKVQHRDIETTSRIDLETIRRILDLVAMFLPIHGMDSYYREIRELLARELDFKLEATNIARIAKSFAGDDRVRFPRVIPELSTSRVMTETYVAGMKIADVAALDAANIDRKDLASRILRAYCQMIFVDGVYHADPHPGNLLVGADGAIVFLDFGAVAEVSKEMREGMPEFVEGVIRRDTDRLMRSLRMMGFIARGTGDDVSEKVVEYFHQRFQDEVKIESFNLSDIKIDPQRGLENLLDLRRMDVTLGEISSAFHIPRDWVLLQRTFLLLTGVCTELDPSLNPVDVVRPYLQEFVLGSRDWTQIALEAAKDTALEAVTLPADLRKYLHKATRGELEVSVKGIGDSARLLYRAVRQGIYAAFTLALGYAALQLYLHGAFQLARYVGYGAGAALVLLAGSLILTSTSVKR